MQDISTPDNSVAVVDQNTINKTKLEQLVASDYETLKEQLRINSEFCIYLEDENGDIIYMDPATIGKGSDTINISGVPCSE